MLRALRNVRVAVVTLFQRYPWIGWVAWGIGWATGFGVVVLSGGRGGLVLCVMGAGTALRFAVRGRHAPENGKRQPVFMKWGTRRSEKFGAGLRV